MTFYIRVSCCAENVKLMGFQHLCGYDATKRCGLCLDGSPGTCIGLQSFAYILKVCSCGGECAGVLLCSILKPFGDADMSIGVAEYGPDWERKGGTSFLMKHCFFNPHDFAVTSNHHVFFQVLLLSR